MIPNETVTSNTETSILEKMAQFMDKNTRGVELGLYSLGFVGLGVALRNVRPFLRFKRPRDIPSSFLEKNLCFKGKVVRVEPTNDSPVLIVDHYPIVSFMPVKDPTSGLPIKLVSADVGHNGLAWMHHILVGKEVTFMLLKANPEVVHCIVTRNNNDVGLNLVSLGFASVSAFDFQLDNNLNYKKYYKKLLKAENNAEKIGIGMWTGGGSMFYKFWYKFWSKLKRKQPIRIAWM